MTTNCAIQLSFYKDALLAAKIEESFQTLSKQTTIKLLMRAHLNLQILSYLLTNRTYPDILPFHHTWSPSPSFSRLWLLLALIYDTTGTLKTNHISTASKSSASLAYPLHAGRVIHKPRSNTFLIHSTRSLKRIFCLVRPLFTAHNVSSYPRLRLRPSDFKTSYQHIFLSISTSHLHFDCSLCDQTKIVCLPATVPMVNPDETSLRELIEKLYIAESWVHS